MREGSVGRGRRGRGERMVGTVVVATTAVSGLARIGVTNDELGRKSSAGSGTERAGRSQNWVDRSPSRRCTGPGGSLEREGP